MSETDLKKIMRMGHSLVSDSVVPQTGEVMSDQNNYIESASSRDKENPVNIKTTGVILSSALITLGQMPLGIRNRVVSALDLRPEKESDGFITILEHKCLVSGHSSYIDPDFIVDEMCTTVYETYLSSEESSYQVPNRVCDITMVGSIYGIIDGSPTAELNFVDAKGKGGDKKNTRRKFAVKDLRTPGSVEIGSAIVSLGSVGDSKNTSRDIAEGEFPKVNGQTFLMPLKPKDESKTNHLNNNIGNADFWQKRGKGVHLALDQFAPLGTPVIAVADGSIQMSMNSRKGEDKWNTQVIAGFARQINARKNDGRLRQLISDQLQKAADMYAGQGKASIARHRLRSKKRAETINYKAIPNAPSTWRALVKWGRKHLAHKSLANLCRNKDLTSWFPVGGREIYLTTDKDQNGNQFRIVMSHFDRYEFKEQFRRVKRGDVIGYVGDTAIFDSAVHLHFAIRAPNDRTADVIQTYNGRTKKGIVPARVIPGIVGAKHALYSKTTL